MVTREGRRQPVGRLVEGAGAQSKPCRGGEESMWAAMSASARATQQWPSRAGATSNFDRLAPRRQQASASVPLSPWLHPALAALMCLPMVHARQQRLRYGNRSLLSLPMSDECAPIELSGRLSPLMSPTRLQRSRRGWPKSCLLGIRPNTCT